ncbi:MAG TPA: M67 family metallopeptidase [Candidatus Acidoferrales bacterium]|nr:M67 family metallopeptidase [Candidatus Acidoferrales bacterium]
MISVVRIRSDILVVLREEASKQPAQECCGLLAGRDEIIARAFPATNALASATAYEITPEGLFRLMREIRVAGLQMLGIYHSHPNGDNSPSPADIARAFYPDAAYFIVSPLPDAARTIRAFSIRDARVTELEIQAI